MFRVTFFLGLWLVSGTECGFLPQPVSPGLIEALGACAAGKVRCGDGRTCVLASWWCDGRNDCPDNSDELDCIPETNASPPLMVVCSEQEFKCHTGVSYEGSACIRRAWTCDSTPDCLDNSDELDCIPETNTSPPLMVVCSEQEFKCHTGVSYEGSACIRRAWTCDGTPDCLDNSDEMCVFEKTGRLPRDLIPFHYEITFRPDINAEKPPFKSSGMVRIHVECHKETSVMHINSKNFSIRFGSIKFMAHPTNKPQVSDPIFTSVLYRPKIDFASFTVQTAFIKGAKYILQLEFERRMDRSGEDGLYWDSYKGLDGRTKYIAATQLEFVNARKAFPCMDEIDMKATFAIAIDKFTTAQVALSNMPVKKVETLPDKWTRTHYENTPVMSTYLVCVVVGEFKKVSAPIPPGTNIKISLYATEKQVMNLEYMKEFAVTMTLKWFEDHTKIPYKEPKMDHIALPSKGDAMENWGLITYGEEILCINKETSSVVGKFNGVTVVTHEIAHMWYGNLVTCKWWDDLWMKEGFATNYNYKPTEYLGWDWMSTQLSDVRKGVQTHMTKDQRHSTTTTVRKDIATPQVSESAFTDGAYGKGGSILRMLHGILTTKVTESAFSKYLKKFAYSNANTKDLMDVLDQEAVLANISHPDKSPLRFNAIFNQWLNIKGFPVVTASKFNSSVIKLTQKIYLRPSGQQIPPTDKTVYSWEIPTNLVTNKSPVKDWDGPASGWIPYKSKGHLAKLPSSTDWYILNPRQYYYYRVQYDQENMGRLIAQLKTDFTKILPETRSNLLEDYFEFARSMMESIEGAMDLTSMLERDFSYNPWQVVMKHSLAIEPIIRTQPYYHKFKLYFQRKLDKILETLTYDFPANETVSTTFLRKNAISSACSFGSPTCLKFAREQYAKYIASPNVNSIDANAAPTVLCDGVFRGKQQDFYTIKQQYVKRKESQAKDERHAYIFAMTCTKQEYQLDSIFEDIQKGETFIGKDLFQATQYLASKKYGAEKLFNYMDENWKWGMGFDKRTTITTITDKWYTEAHVKKIDAFIKRRESDSTPLPQRIKNFLVLNQLQVNDNHAFFMGQTKILGKWLDRNVKVSLREILDQKVMVSNPSNAFKHWQMLEESYRTDIVENKNWE